jgi:glutathione synthase/RimK-type ligase-like ATP-grasp enzyme
MNRVATFFKLPEVLDYPLSKADYFDAYTELGQKVEAKGGQFFVVRGMSTYEGNGHFSQSWKFVNGQLEAAGPLTADVVFDRGEFETDGQVLVFNHPDINHLCTDKWAMYQRFAEYCPKTWLVHSQAELEQALSQVSTKLVVAKPVDGQEGEGVMIDTAAVIASQKWAYPVLVQDFIDTSFGIPGIVEGLHDLRVALVNGEIMYSYFRTPPQGSYLANVARGGKFSMIDPTKLPGKVLEIVSKIDGELASVGSRFYGIDFGITQDGPKIIEMNSRLGLLPNRDDQAFVRLKEKLAEVLTLKLDLAD